ncbi:MAG: DUF4058 family protein [Cyanobacteria bacterium P01_A01_bin.116]
MGFPFTGINPYLENSATWPDLHSRLLVEGMAQRLRRIEDGLNRFDVKGILNLSDIAAEVEFEAEYEPSKMGALLQKA